MARIQILTQSTSSRVHFSELRGMRKNSRWEGRKALTCERFSYVNDNINYNPAELVSRVHFFFFGPENLSHRRLFEQRRLWRARKLKGLTQLRDR